MPGTLLCQFCSQLYVCASCVHPGLLSPHTSIDTFQLCKKWNLKRKKFNELKENAPNKEYVRQIAFWVLKLKLNTHFHKSLSINACR